MLNKKIAFFEEKMFPKKKDLGNFTKRSLCRIILVTIIWTKPIQP